ncbi:uncharacterized protein [Triticum aestivum]|nr:uncharacterized protein LOC123119231 isoform X4 [Triticum aestivum]
MNDKHEQSIVDLTETDASDGMLFDGLRRILEERQERKQERSALKEKRNKRRRPEEGKPKRHINKERATAYSRFSIGYFAKIVDVVCKSNHRMEVVRNGGFGYLLELDDCYVPWPFAQWVADNISTKDEAIVLGGKSIPLNPEAVSLVLGIPAGGTKITVLDEEFGKAEFLSLFGLTDLPSISFFRNKIINEELPDDVYLRCFLTVALATFLCPTSNTKPSTKYLGALVDVSKSKDLDWCSFVHTWNITYVKKYQTDKLKQKRITTTLGGCIYQLAVRCLDFNNFGSITIPPALPKVCFWKGQTIKHFSDMLIGKDGLYGALQIKDEAETCYAETDGAWASTAKNSNIQKALQRVLGNSFSDKIKEDIFLNFQERVKDQNLTTCLIAKQVLLDTLNIVSSSFNGSQHTEKLESSDKDNGSGSTIRVDSNGIEIGSDRRGRKKRMKTSTQESITSTSKYVLLQDKIKQSTPEVDTQGVKAELQPVPWNGPINEPKHQDEMEVNSEIGKGCTHIVGQPVRAECIALQQEAHEGESMNKVGPAKHNQDTNMLDGHSNILERSVNACPIEIEAPQKSTSLNYMLLSARLAKAVMSTTQVNNSKEVSTRDVQTTFTGLQHNTVNNNKTQHCIDTSTMEQRNEKQAVVSECVEHQNNIDKDQNTANNVSDYKKRVELDIDINIALSNNDKQQHVKELQDTLHPLDIARQKYFFTDDATPSCRILPDHDDCGNQIIEPELWRPLEMNSEEYNSQIEEAKKKYPCNASKDEQEVQGDSSIQCAQRQPVSTGICKYRDFLPQFEEKDGIIDLTSPVARMSHTWGRATTYYSRMGKWNNENAESPTQKHKKRYSTTAILGKRLFSDEFDENDEQEGTKHQPIPVSPDVQVLGERSFNGSCSSMVNTADNLYNTKLSLGTSSSGKENLPPKRITHPSKWLSSPYDHNERGPLQPHEIELHRGIVALSKVEPHRSKVVVLIDKTSLFLGQLGDSFGVSGHVEAYVFNVFCRMLFRENHPRRSKTHYFFTTLGDYFLENWKSEEGRREMKRKTLRSFNGAGKALPLHESDRINNFIKTWEDSNLRGMSFRKFGVEYPNMPKQIGSDACGIFALNWMQTWASRNPMQRQFTMNDVANARVRFAVDILFSIHNTEDQGKILVKNFAW